MKTTITLLALLMTTTSFAASMTVKPGTVDLTINNTLRDTEVTVNSVSSYFGCYTQYKGWEVEDGIRYTTLTLEDAKPIEVEAAPVTIASHESKAVVINYKSNISAKSPEKRSAKVKFCKLTISASVSVKDLITQKTIGESFTFAYLDTVKDTPDAVAAIMKKHRSFDLKVIDDGTTRASGGAMCALVLQTVSGKNLTLGWTEEYCPKL